MTRESLDAIVQNETPSLLQLAQGELRRCGVKDHLS